MYRTPSYILFTSGNVRCYVAHGILHTAVKEFFFLKVTWKTEIKAPLHFMILCSKINKFMYIAHVDINDYIT